jgi:hypothetical protein
LPLKHAHTQHCIPHKHTPSHTIPRLTILLSHRHTLPGLSPGTSHRSQLTGPSGALRVPPLHSGCVLPPGRTAPSHSASCSQQGLLAQLTTTLQGCNTQPRFRPAGPRRSPSCPAPSARSPFSGHSSGGAPPLSHHPALAHLLRWTGAASLQNRH